jgi:hypothetical protein
MYFYFSIWSAREERATREKRAERCREIQREVQREREVVPVGDVELTGVGNDCLDGLDLVLGQLAGALCVVEYVSTCERYRESVIICVRLLPPKRGHAFPPSQQRFPSIAATLSPATLSALPPSFPFHAMLSLSIFAW